MTTWTVGAIFGACIIVFFLPMQAVFSIMFWRRREYQPLRARLPGLVVITDFFMMMWILQLGLQRISQDVYPCLLNLWSSFIGVVVLFNTYMWRCWVLYFTFELTQERLKGTAKKNSTFIQNRFLVSNLFAFKFLGTLTCILLLPAGLLTATNEQISILRGDDCNTSWGNYVIMVYICGYTLSFIYLTVKLHSVVESFRIKEELILTAVVALCTFPPWLLFNTQLKDVNNNLFPFSTLTLCMGVFAQFCVSTIWPLWLSLKQSQMIDLEAAEGVDISTLNGLLASKNGRASFKNFLTKEFSVENIVFYEEIEEFRRKKENGAEEVDLVSEAQRIYAKYIISDAPFQVNLPQSIVKELDELLRNIFSLSAGTDWNAGFDLLTEPGYIAPATPTLFDRAQLSIFKLMNTDSFPRYQRSDDYKKLIKEMAEKKKKAEILKDEGLVAAVSSHRADQLGNSQHTDASSSVLSSVSVLASTSSLS